jgi:rare lipoprotein A
MTTAPFPALSFLPLAAAIPSLASCSSRLGDYSGYMTRSYKIRGQAHHPMSVEQALGHKETGIRSWYDESSFFGLKRGTTSLGEKVKP